MRVPVIATFKFDPDTFPKIKVSPYGHNWPVVYILEDGKEAYIGETTSAVTRFKQHYDRPERRQLTRAHLISDGEYNKSATQDIESQLIQYLVADGSFRLQNGNGGLLNHNYFDREKYQAKFELIWEELKTKKIVSKDLLQLKNSDIFKYSPYKSLNDDQLQIVEDIISQIKTNPNGTYVVHGEPGTGKTILGVYLMKNLQEHDETKQLKAALVVPMTSLRQTLKNVFANVKGLSRSMVIGPSEVIGKDYDLLIVDESHRLRRRTNITNYASFDKSNKALALDKNGTELDWIMHSSRYRVLLYDERQSVRPSDIRPVQIRELPRIDYRLTSQMRIQGGEDYLRFIEDLLALITVKPYKSEKYIFKVCKSIHELRDIIDRREREGGLSRLLAGYSWPWITKDNESLDYDIEIDGLRLKWNGRLTDWVNSKNAPKEVGCIHTVQGYDLNYAGVIIGPELRYDEITHELKIDKDKYEDINGKNGIRDPDELRQYILNIYNALLTRGIKGTYVYAADPSLQKYLLPLSKL